MKFTPISTCVDRIPLRSIDLDNDLNFDIMNDSLLRFPSEGWMDRAGSLVGVPNITCNGFASLLTLTMSCRHWTAFFEALISCGCGWR